MNRVFVVNEPMSRDHITGQWVRHMDLSPAAEFGKLVFLLPAGQIPADLSAVVQPIKRGLAGYTVDDYLLPVGDIVAIGIATALASVQAGGRLKMLRWDWRGRCYRPVDVDLNA